MARNGHGVIHNDAYQTDTYRVSGPLGPDIATNSTFQVADCAAPTFTRRGQIVVTCVGLQGPRLMLFDPATLETMATYNLPLRRVGNLSFFTDFSGGGYFYLDNQDRAVLPTTDGRILVVGVTNEPGFGLVEQYRVRGELEEGEGINSAMPDWNGRIWFVGTEGSVGRGGPQDRRGARRRSERGHRELLQRRRDRRGLHRHRPRALPLRSGQGRQAQDHLARALSERRGAEARPDR